MNNPGIYDLGDRIITTALTGEVITLDSDSNEFISSLEGMISAGIQIRFAYGSGGTTCKVYVQTSLDQGTTWIDVICASFTTISKTNVYNLSGLTPKTTAVLPVDGALADDTCVDGVLGERWRTKVTSTGTYAGNTSLNIRLNAR